MTPKFIILPTGKRLDLSEERPIKCRRCGCLITVGAAVVTVIGFYLFAVLFFSL